MLYYSNLDKLLGILISLDNSKNESRGYAGILTVTRLAHELNLHLKPEVASRKKVIAMVHKLVTDKYITHHSAFEGIFAAMQEDAWNVTFEGYVFFASGGYTAEYRFRQSEIEKANKLVGLQRQMNLLTLIISVGTALAAIYYFLEVVNMFYPFKVK